MPDSEKSDPPPRPMSPDSLRPIVWSEAFEMGDAELDTEHCGFIGLVNRLTDALRAGEGADAVAVACDRLVDHSEAHFRNEEEIMVRHGYGGIEAHRRDHERLLVFIREQAARIRRSAARESHAAAADIKDALLGHMFRVDIHYKSYMLESKNRRT